MNNSPLNSPNAGPTSSADSETLLSILWRQRYVMGTCLAVSLAAGAVAFALLPRKYTAVAKVEVSSRDPAAMATGAPDNSNAEAESGFVYSQILVMKSTPVLGASVANDDIRELAVFNGVDNRIRYLKKELNVTKGERDNVISVSLKAKDREEATRIVQSVVDTYKNYQADKKRADSQVILNILTADLEATNRAREATQAKLDEARQRSGIIDVDQSTNSILTQRVRSIYEALSKAHLETIAAETAYNQALRALGSDVSKLSDDELNKLLGEGTALSSQGNDQVASQLFILQQRLAEYRKSYLPSHPSIIRTEGQIRQIRIGQAAGARSNWMALRDQELELKHDYEVAQSEVIASNNKASEIQELQDTLRRNKDQLDDITRRQRDLTMQMAAAGFNIKITEAANTDEIEPTPQLPQTMAIALALGAITGLGLSLAKHWHNPKLASSSAAIRTLSIPTLATLPHQNNATGTRGLAWASYMDQNGVVAEVSRTLADNLAAEGEPFSVMMTSAQSNEGKTTVACNLAISLALQGRRVLMVDANFRAPMLHRIFEVAGLRGFADALQGSELAELIKPSAVAGLDILPAGTAPMRAAELLGGQAFDDFIAGCRDRYDTVIFDGSPVLEGTDATVIGSNVEAVVLVVRATQSSARTSGRARDRLAHVGALLRGTVLNDERGNKRMTIDPVAVEQRLRESLPEAV